MSENYIVINGKRAELTEEQLNKLGIKPEKNKYEEMFERQEKGKLYFYISSNSDVASYIEDYDIVDNSTFRAGNYCKNANIIKQRALHETLNRLLWRASVIAGELDNLWDSQSDHYYIFYDTETKHFIVNSNLSWSMQGVCYFPTAESASDAIKNIIKPFMKEHPDFVW